MFVRLGCVVLCMVGKLKRWFGFLDEKSECDFSGGDIFFAPRFPVQTFHADPMRPEVKLEVLYCHKMGFRLIISLSI